ncbi:MAG: hypothetical protein ACJ77K_03110 [Bacteroidia bacterium]
MNFKKITLIALIALGTTSAFAQAEKKKKSPFDGRIYSITLNEEKEGKKKPDPIKEDFSFQPVCKAKSTTLSNEGFMQTDYDYEVDSTTTPVTYKFTIEAKDNDNTRFSWEGTLSGDNIEGTAILRKKGKIQHSYNFTGTWKNKKKAKPAPKPAATAAPDSTKKSGE